MTKPFLRAGALALLMALAVWVASFWRPTHFTADDRPPVVLEELFPRDVGGWTVDRSIVPIRPSPDQQKVIDATYDQTLARTYRNSQGRRIMLSVAYGRNQHEGMNTHRPEVCYPAQGFRITEEGVRGSLMFGDLPIGVTRLVTANGSRNEPITYWLIVGDRIIHFGSEHKWHTLRYGLKGKIPDGMLLRVSSIDQDVDQAFTLHQQFVVDLLNAMKPAARQVVLGTV